MKKTRFTEQEIAHAVKQAELGVSVLTGCVLFALVMTFASAYQFDGSIVCMLVIFVFRAAAIWWRLQVPDWALIGSMRAS